MNAMLGGTKTALTNNVKYALKNPTHFAQNAKNGLDPGDVFADPATPPVTPPPAPPTMAGNSNELDIATQDEMRRLQRGRSATMLTGGSGVADMGSTSKTLLGS